MVRGLHVRDLYWLAALPVLSGCGSGPQLGQSVASMPDCGVQPGCAGSADASGIDGSAGSSGMGGAAAGGDASGCVNESAQPSPFATWPMPNPASSGLPNPSSYDTSHTGVVIDG